MFRVSSFPRPSRFTSALGVSSVCLWVMACAPANDDNPSPGASGAGMGSGAAAGSASGGSAGVSAVGGSLSTGGAPGAGPNTGGSLSGGAGVGGGGGANGGAMNAGGSAGSAGGGGVTVAPVPLDPALMERCTGKNPIKCTIPVPANGNYNVTVELGSAQAASTSQVLAELYRIVTPPITLAADAYSQATFSVNVRAEDHDDYDAPGKELNILIDGNSAALRGLGYAAATLPTLFVAGDSTVCDWDPARSGLGPTQRGWAQEFSLYLKPGLAVANYADSGDTAGSLYGKFASRGAMLKEGDYLFIQFGHNDMKTEDGRANYKANLMKFVNDARAAKATPILFSPAARKAHLDSGTPATVEDPGFNGLDQQARDLAKAENIAFVDLTTLSINYYGTVDESLLFTSKTEIAHFNIAGATAISQLVADALKAGTMPATSIADFLR